MAMMLDKKSLFITIEGTEGSGKTTILQLVSTYLQRKGLSIVLTREPGGIRISEQIRKILLDTENTEMNPKTEALLFAAARSQHYEEIIKPALEQGKFVLCDRFIDSSVVYQGVVRKLGVGPVEDISRFAIGYGRIPDLTILLDVRPEVGLQRIYAAGGREINRLDLEKLEFHRSIYDGYKDLAAANPSRIKVIDGERTVEEVAEDAIKKIEEALSSL